MRVVSRTSGVLGRLVSLARRPAPCKPGGRWAVGDGAGNAFRRADQGSWDNGAVAHQEAEHTGFLLVVTNGGSPGYKATELGLFQTKSKRNN